MPAQTPKPSQPANDVDADPCLCRVVSDPNGSGVFLDVHADCPPHGCTCAYRRDLASRFRGIGTHTPACRMTLQRQAQTQLT